MKKPERARPGFRLKKANAPLVLRGARADQASAFSAALPA